MVVTVEEAGSQVGGGKERMLEAVYLGPPPRSFSHSLSSLSQVCSLPHLLGEGLAQKLCDALKVATRSPS